MVRAIKALLATATLLCGCGESPQRSIETNEFGGAVANALFVDLNEAPTTTTVLLLQTRSSQPQMRVLALPFASAVVAPDRQLLLSTGTHGKITILSIIATPASPDSSLVRLKPAYEQSDESDFSRDDLRGSAYFLSSGLKRRFFYRAPSASELTSEPWQSLAAVTNTSLSHLVVRIPAGSEVFERPTLALAPEFDKDSLKGKIRGYPYSKLSTAPIDLRYQIAPTRRQEQVFEYGIKLFIALIAPLAALAILTSDKVRSVRTRKVVLAAGVVVEVLVLAGLVWWSFYIQSVAGLGAILDVALAALGAAATILLVLIKKPITD